MSTNGSCDQCVASHDPSRMSFDDFKRNFTDVEICNITLDQFDEDQSSKLSDVNSYHGNGY